MCKWRNWKIYKCHNINLSDCKNVHLWNVAGKIFLVLPRKTTMIHENNKRKHYPLTHWVLSSGSLQTAKRETLIQEYICNFSLCHFTHNLFVLLHQLIVVKALFWACATKKMGFIFLPAPCLRRWLLCEKEAVTITHPLPLAPYSRSSSPGKHSQEIWISFFHPLVKWKL